MKSRTSGVSWCTSGVSWRKELLSEPTICSSIERNGNFPTTQENKFRYKIINILFRQQSASSLKSWQKRIQDSGQVHNAVRPKIICILSIELGSVKEIAMVVENLGNTSHKNKCFLSGIAQITPPPLSGNLYIFFGRQKRRFTRMTEKVQMMIMMVAIIIMMVILMIMMTKITKKQTNIKSFG